MEWWKAFIESQYKVLFSDEIEATKLNIENLKTRIRSLVENTKIWIEKPALTGRISLFEAHDMFKKAFPKSQIFLSDKEYSITSISEASKFLQHDLTDVQKFEKEVKDCDDFSRSLWNYWRDWQSDLAIGLLWIVKPYAHALNVAILSNEKGEKCVYVIEPQNDRIYPVPDNYIAKLIVM